LIRQQTADERALMARRGIEMFDLIELYMRWQAARSQVQLWQSLGMDRKTIRKHVAPALAEGIEPDGESLSAEQWAERIAEWFPGLDDPGMRAVTWPLIEPHRDRIKGWLDGDVTVARIAQRLRDDHEVAVSESSVRRWIATHFAEEVARAKGPGGGHPRAPPVRALHRLLPLPAGEDRLRHENPTWCRHIAAEVGPACQAVIAEFMRDNAIHHLRSAQGVLGLRDKYGCDRLDAACARALAVATRRIGPSRASWPPAPNTAISPPPAPRPQRGRCCAARSSSAPPAPTTPCDDMRTNPPPAQHKPHQFRPKLPDLENQAYIFFKPASILTVGRHPSAISLVLSIILRGVPSGREVSNSTRPSNPTMDLIKNARSRIEISSLEPTLIIPPPS
jgi:hypothetical protein